MLVFRDGRETVPGRRHLRELESDLLALTSASHTDPNLLLDALLRSGELECALADASLPGTGAQPGFCETHVRIVKTTDALADALLGRPFTPAGDAGWLESLPVPDQLAISPAEGFAYYALHPLNYADLATELARRRTAIVGIRSIGTTLAAVVAAAVRKQGFAASRTSVRPTGHPFDRRLDLDGDTCGWVAAEREAGSEFWVVDEGPGLSGSSFLAVGEALERAGVGIARIRFLCSVPPRLESLCARDAAARWRRFQVHSVAGPWRRPGNAAIDISAGRWRERVFRPPKPWPASWTSFERRKFLSADNRRLYKFEGLGRFGRAVMERAQAVSAAMFGVPPRAESDGFVSYPIILGRTAADIAVTREVLDRLAEYCAFRSTAFATERADQSALENMLAWNYFEEFGEELDGARRHLPMERLTVVDGRMQPHEWLVNHWLFKTDGAGHGDDHFFPGPTDIAWDVAGVIVEWALDAAASQYFVNRYCSRSFDDVRRRLPNYLLAYVMFRLGYSKMAADAMHGSDEAARLTRDYERYRTIAMDLQARSAAA